MGQPIGSLERAADASEARIDQRRGASAGRRCSATPRYPLPVSHQWWAGTHEPCRGDGAGPHLRTSVTTAAVPRRDATTGQRYAAIRASDPGARRRGCLQVGSRARAAHPWRERDRLRLRLGTCARRRRRRRRCRSHVIGRRAADAGLTSSSASPRPTSGRAHSGPGCRTGRT